MNELGMATGATKTPAGESERVTRHSPSCAGSRQSGSPDTKGLPTRSISASTPIPTRCCGSPPLFRLLHPVGNHADKDGDVACVAGSETLLRKSVGTHTWRLLLVIHPLPLLSPSGQEHGEVDGRVGGGAAASGPAARHPRRPNLVPRGADWSADQNGERPTFIRSGVYLEQNGIVRKSSDKTSFLDMTVRQEKCLDVAGPRYLSVVWTRRLARSNEA
jgi:hypothetical protein